MNKQFIVVVAVIVLGLFGILMFTRQDKKDDQGGNQNASAQTSNHIAGNPNASVTLVEYADFQCPACAVYFPVVQQLKTEYADNLKFQFKHFPLVSIHPNAFIASRAAEAASKQNKFFEMHDLLFQNQDAWAQVTDPTETFVGYATQLNLNTEQFKSDMRSEVVGDTINADLKEGQGLGANSTPTFFINGRKIEPNPQTLDDFKKIIDEEIAKASGQNQNQ